MFSNSETKVRKFSLRTILILPFILLISSTVFFVGYFSLNNGQKAVNDVANQLLVEVSDRVDQNLRPFLKVPDTINRMNNELIRMGLLDINNTKMMEAYMWKQVKVHDNVAFIGYGTEEKEIIGAERLSGLINLRVSTRESNYIFNTYSTDQKNGEKKRITDSIAFDPRSRPWYKAAREAGKAVWGPIYPNTAGLASYLGFSMPFYYPDSKFAGVLLCNVNLTQIGDYLQSLKISKSGQAMIIEKNGMLVATSTGEKPFRKEDKAYGAKRVKATNSKNHLSRELASFIENKIKSGENFTESINYKLSVDNEAHYIVVKPFRDDYGLDWLIIVDVPENDFMQKVNENTRTTILLCLLAMFLATLIGLYITRKISEPLMNISTEMKYIANFDLEKKFFDTKKVSPLYEIDIIQNSLISMKKGLRSFEKYVSSEIVRRLIKANKEAVLGVEHSNVTIFFSDVADFTTISESMPLNNLVDVMSEYLGEMTDIIMESGGTLDKYIGDAIMAFWNAPQPVENHPLIACQAALDCQKRLKELQTQWEKRGLPALRCRIGLNTGDVLVGNLGSRQRMDYTVIGDTVNLSSRLEGLCKQYGVDIIISESIYQSVKNQYLCRPLDFVVVKGRSKTTKIYELIEKSELADFKQEDFVDSYSEALWLYKSSDFSKAKTAFQRISEKYPDDYPTKILLQRCRDFEEKPPDNDWDGSNILLEK